MATLISSVARLQARIEDYCKQVQEMTDVMPYNRAWYAMRRDKKWLFGPSKFVGYDDLNAKEYLKNANGGSLDGRVTEGVLQKWSELVEEGHPKYDELHTSLNEFCAGFGKKPNSLSRISIVKTKNEVSSGSMFSDELVSLMVAVYRQLTPAQKSAFQKQAA